MGHADKIRRSFKQRSIRNGEVNTVKHIASRDITKDCDFNYISVEYLVLQIKKIPFSVIPIDTCRT